MCIKLKNDIIIIKDEILDMLSKEGIISEKDIVYVSGSLVEPIVNADYSDMGNCSSDIDLFVIIDEKNGRTLGDKLTGYKKEHKITIFQMYNEIGCDIEIFSKNSVKELSEAINNIQLSNHMRTRNGLKVPEGWSDRDIKSFINRLNYSIPISGNEEYHKLKNSINYNKYSQYRIRRLTNEIDNIISDIWGNLSRNTFDTCVFLVREAYLKLMELILYRVGQTVDRDKWVSYKFMRMVEIFPEYEPYREIYKTIFLEQLEDYEYGKQCIVKAVECINEFFIDVEV